MADPHIDIIFSEVEEPEAADFLQGKIREFNNARSPHHRAIQAEGAVTPLFLLLKDTAGELIGGLSGSTYWSWLSIEYLFVPEELRGKNIGAKLLAMAEEVAVKRGCKHCYLTTFEFQARDFYQKHGYTVAGHLEDYPPGVTYYWMQKELPAVT
ncbi:MAG: GNAT family N-acetyltransferase [Anaerolineaceae bacterium]